MNTPDIHQFIGRIYDAALNPALWDALMVDLTDAVGGSVGVLVLNHDGIPGYALIRRGASAQDASAAATFAGPETLAKYTRWSPEVLDHYLEHFFLEKDLWYQKVRESCRSGSVFIGSELIEDRELKKTDFYQESLRPGDGGYLLGGISHMNATHLSGVTVSRPLSWGDFGSEEKAFLGVLLPHLARAQQLHGHYLECRQSCLAAEQAMQLASTAMVLIGADGNILFLNRSAETILEQQDGLMQKQGELAARNLNDHSLLYKHIHEAIATARRKAEHSGQAIVISRPSGKMPYQLVISPLNLHTDQSLPTLGAAACVFIHDSHRYLHLSTELLKELYQLTPSECKVAQLFYRNRPLAGIAGTLGISITTARTHLYNIMTKTGTHTQAELIKLLALGPGAMRAGEMEV